MAKKTAASEPEERPYKTTGVHLPADLWELLWLNPANFALRLQGGEQHGAPTVIIDEASMIPMDLFGVLFRALDLNKVSRLILVGDPNQLPPIGPGRPLVDIISWLENDNDRKKCLARLMERARHEDHESQALQLADGYLRDDTSPGDDDMLSRIAREDVGAIWKFAIGGTVLSWKSSLPLRCGSTCR